MKRSKFSDEQILAIVKEGEAGRKVSDVCRTHGITEQTYYRWKAKFDGMELSEMQRLKQLEDENRRLKHIVAEQTLDIQVYGPPLNCKDSRPKELNPRQCIRPVCGACPPLALMGVARIAPD